ncbi:MAG: hypothetical protein R3B69_04185 [Candidatus Paceibacterota bacterium]
MQRLITSAVAGILMLVPTTAPATSSLEKLTATRLALACPDLHLIHTRKHGGWFGFYLQRKIAKVAKCATEAEKRIVADPYPVNMGGKCHATNIRISNGMIVLSCP